MEGARCKEAKTHSLLDLAELLKLLAESGIVGVPGKATVMVQRWGVAGFSGDTHPIKSLVDMV